MILVFYYFSDDPPLDNDEDEKDKQDEYSVDQDDHDDEDSDEEQKESIKEAIILFLEINPRCLMLKNYPQYSISRSSGAITAPKTWPPKQTYNSSKSLESVLTQKHKKLKNLLVFKCWCQ